MSAPALRPYRLADRAALYQICLRTGDSGGDATGQFADPDLLGHVYLGPYLLLCPQLAIVLEDPAGAPVGYAVGTSDTPSFEKECERRWWPWLRWTYPDPAQVPASQRTPDQRLAHMIHHPTPTPPAITDRYPAHLHVNLLPAAQGRGFGRALLDRLLAELLRAGAGGVHLGVAASNHPAMAFYRRLGFIEIEPFTFAADLGRTDVG